MTLDESLTIREKHDALLALTQSTGYRLFLEMMAKLDTAALQRMVKAENPHEMAKACGKYELGQFIQNWATGNLYNLRGYLETEQLQKKGQ